MHKVFSIYILGLLFFPAAGNLNTPAWAESRAQKASKQKYIKVPVKRKPTDSDWTLRETRTIELLGGFQPGSKRIRYSKYGGRLGKKAEARGFFYPK